MLQTSQKIAFHSVRGLDDSADATVNTAYWLAMSSVSPRYMESRRAVLDALRQTGGIYTARAAQPRSRGAASPIGELRAAGDGNLDQTFTEGKAPGINLAPLKVRKKGIALAFIFHNVRRSTDIRDGFDLLKHRKSTGTGRRGPITSKDLHSLMAVG